MVRLSRNTAVTLTIVRLFPFVLWPLAGCTSQHEILIVHATSEDRSHGNARPAPTARRRPSVLQSNFPPHPPQRRITLVNADSAKRRNVSAQGPPVAFVVGAAAMLAALILVLMAINAQIAKYQTRHCAVCRRRLDRRGRYCPRCGTRT